MLGKMGIHEAIASFMTRAAQRKGKYGLRTRDSVTADYRVYTVRTATGSGHPSPSGTKPGTIDLGRWS